MKCSIRYKDEYQLVDLFKFFDEVGEVLSDIGIGTTTFDIEDDDTICIGFNCEEDMFRFQIQYPSIEELLDDTIRKRQQIYRNE